jgi:hypothetical protein
MQYKKLSTLNMVASHCVNNINLKKKYTYVINLQRTRIKIGHQMPKCY